MTNTMDLKGLRESLGLTKAEMAKKLGVTAMVYGRYESGRHMIPDHVLELIEEIQEPAPVEEEKASVEEEKTAENAPVDEEITPAKLTAFRESLGLTKTVMANTLGVTPMVYGRYESGKNKMPECVLQIIKDIMKVPGPVEEKPAPVEEEKAAEPAPVEAKNAPVEEEITPAQLATLRGSLGLTKTEMAKKIGVTAMVYGRYESGKNKMPERVLQSIKDIQEPAPMEEEKASEPAPVEEEKTAEPAPVEEEKAAETAAEPAEEAASKPIEIFIQSMSGQSILLSEIEKRLPAGVETVYIKPEENRAYWVKGAVLGSVEVF